MRTLVAQLDGCSGATAGEIIDAVGLSRTVCKDVSRAQATALLNEVRDWTRSVSVNRLGCLGRPAFPGYWYAIERGHARIGGSEPQAEIPFVVEVWATKQSHKSEANGISVNINRTPSTGETSIYRDGDKRLSIVGSGLTIAARPHQRRAAISSSSM